MASKRSIDQLLAVVRADPTNMAIRVELADLYTKAGDMSNALATYEEVAKYCAYQGFPIKAIAVYKQICSMVVADAPHLRHRYAHVPPILSELFQRLGMNKQAVSALDALDALGEHGGHGPS
jgi:protein involved in temperature-dependent protein secretion